MKKNCWLLLFAFFAVVLCCAAGPTILGIVGGGTGTGSTLTGLVRGSSTAMTAAELSGDASTSGSNVVTVSKINGTAFSGTNGDLVTFGASNIPADSGILATNALVSGGAAGTPSSITLTHATGLPCGALPALTGAVTTSAGSCGTSLGAATVPSGGVVWGSTWANTATAFPFSNQITVIGMPNSNFPMTISTINTYFTVTNGTNTSDWGVYNWGSGSTFNLVCSTGGIVGTGTGPRHDACTQGASQTGSHSFWVFAICGSGASGNGTFYEGTTGAVWSNTYSTSSTCTSGKLPSSITVTVGTAIYNQPIVYGALSN